MARKGKKTKSRRAGRSPRRRQRAGARRFVLLFVLVLIALLYAGPLRSYYAKRELVNRQSGQVATLRSEQKTLARNLHRASTREAAEREARRLFYVKPGEHLYVVQGIERWQRSRATSRK